MIAPLSRGLRPAGPAPLLSGARLLRRASCLIVQGAKKGFGPAKKAQVSRTSSAAARSSAAQQKRANGVALGDLSMPEAMEKGCLVS